MKTTAREENNFMDAILALTNFTEAEEKIFEGEEETENPKSASAAYYAGDFEGRNKAKENRSKRRKTSILMDMKKRRDGPTNKGYHAHRIRYSNSKSNFECATNGMAMHSDRRRVREAEDKLKEYYYESEAGTDVDRADTTTEKETIDHTENMTDHITQVFVDALIKDGVSPDVAHDLAMNIWLACDDYNLAEVAYGK